MTTVLRILPSVGVTDLHALLDSLVRAPAHRPFAEPLVQFAAELSVRLLSDREARTIPALQALGFWTRLSALQRLRAGWDAGQGRDAVAVPRGLVFHIPPGNVDTIFVYSWLLSLLVGNRNVIRLPSQETRAIGILCRIMGEMFAAAPAVAAGTAILRYGHDDHITAALSAACDLRVIWGGDRTVRHIRGLPLAPHASEIAFADRFSLSALDASAVTALTPNALEELARRFFNDSYWFDQLGCSSPRIVVWIGSAAAVVQASETFFKALARAVKEKAYEVDVGTALGKIAYSHRAVLDLPVSAVRQLSNELLVLQLDPPCVPRADLYGAGTFFETRLEQLADLAQFVRRQDQTLTVFGFTTASTRELAVTINGAGIDRIVPVGEALSFHHLWDGNDLLRSFTRLVHVGV